MRKIKGRRHLHRWKLKRSLVGLKLKQTQCAKIRLECMIEEDGGDHMMVGWVNDSRMPVKCRNHVSLAWLKRMGSWDGRAKYSRMSVKCCKIRLEDRHVLYDVSTHCSTAGTRRYIFKFCMFMNFLEIRIFFPEMNMFVGYVISVAQV